MQSCRIICKMNRIPWDVKILLCTPGVIVHSMKTEENHLALGYQDSFQAIISCIMVEEYGMTESLTLEIAIRVPLIYKSSVQFYLKFN